MAILDQIPVATATLRNHFGVDLLSNPILNKGTAFTDLEREELGLHGLLPVHVETIEEQVERAYEEFNRKTDPLEKHIFLRALQDTNEVLFYRLLLDHLDEMTPIVYTPIVGQACQQFSHIYRRHRGLFVSYPQRNNIRALLRNRPYPEVDVIVVTDGERILGLGDQGAGGMGIPIGKLSLYALFGGIHPERTLPVVLDCGTNNPNRLSDPEYLGWRHQRIVGADYDVFVDRFVQAVKEELPNVLLQWEDFANSHAMPLLQRYQDQLLTFNDDIQGTAAVTLGAILGAINVSRKSMKDQNVVFLGAGSAALGVADYLCTAMRDEGISEAEARSRIWMLDSKGLIHSGRTDLSSAKQAWSQPAERLANWEKDASGHFDLAQVIHRVDATILIGLSTIGGAFTEAIVRDMASKVDRPIIFPLSNPTDRSEATAEDLLRWTEGRALIATGSPFAPVQVDGKLIPISQCNNVYIFPGVGLGLIASGARRVTDSMLTAAARALARHSPAIADPSAPILPSLHMLRKIAIDIAVAVGREAQALGYAPETTEQELRQRVLSTFWNPVYPAHLTTRVMRSGA